MCNWFLLGPREVILSATLFASLKQWLVKTPGMLNIFFISLTVSSSLHGVAQIPLIQFWSNIESASVMIRLYHCSMHQFSPNMRAQASVQSLVPCPRGLEKAMMNLPRPSLITPPPLQWPPMHEPSLFSLTKRIGGLIHLAIVVWTSTVDCSVILQMSSQLSPNLTFLNCSLISWNIEADHRLGPYNGRVFLIILGAASRSL